MGRVEIHESEYKWRTYSLVVFITLLVAALVNFGFLFCGFRGWIHISLYNTGRLFIGLLVLTLLARLAWEFYDAQREALQRFRELTNA